MEATKRGEVRPVADLDLVTRSGKGRVPAANEDPTKELAGRNHAKAPSKSQSDGATPRQVGDDWQEPESQDLPWLKFESVEELPDTEPEQVVEGLLHVGEKLGITAGSKNFKTWLLLCVGYCIANGLAFLGFKTNQAKVIFFDLELSRNGLRRRLEKIKKAVGKGDFTNITVCSLRGKAKLFCTNFEKIIARIKEAGFKVVIIDPAYKFMLGKNESDNGLVADMLERLTVFCMEAEVALIYVHHHSKGNQAGKESLDRGSGAGAWSRDPDSVLDLVDHKHSTKEEKIYTAEITVREFPPIENFVVRWKFPLLVRDTEGLDPEELKQSKPRGPEAKFDVSQIVKLLKNEQLSTTKFKNLVINETGMSKTIFYKLLKEAEQQKLIVQDGITGTWERYGAGS